MTDNMLNEQAREDLYAYYTTHPECNDIFWNILCCAGLETEFSEFLETREED